MALQAVGTVRQQLHVESTVEGGAWHMHEVRRKLGILEP